MGDRFQLNPRANAEPDVPKIRNFYENLIVLVITKYRFRSQWECREVLLRISNNLTSNRRKIAIACSPMNSGSQWIIRGHRESHESREPADGVARVPQPEDVVADNYVQIERSFIDDNRAAS